MRINWDKLHFSEFFHQGFQWDIGRTVPIRYGTLTAGMAKNTLQIFRFYPRTRHGVFHSVTK